MKYFTPELIQRMNASEMDVVMAALEEWEDRLAAYQKRLDTIWARLPRSVRRYLGHVRLHDAPFLGAVRPSNGSSASTHVALLLRQEDRLLSLRYEVVGRLVVDTVLPPHLRSDGPLWLYDEIDLVRGGLCQHRILLSSGEELTLRFRKLQVTEGDWLLPARESRLKAVS